MANIADIEMTIKGKEENVKAFLDKLACEVDEYIGNGFDDINKPLLRKDGESLVATVTGTIRWSAEYAYNNNQDGGISIEDAAKKFEVEVEGFTSELGNGFQEHFYIKDDILQIDAESAVEITLYPTYEETIEENSINLTEYSNGEAVDEVFTENFYDDLCRSFGDGSDIVIGGYGDGKDGLDFSSSYNYLEPVIRQEKHKQMERED